MQAKSPKAKTYGTGTLGCLTTGTCTRNSHEVYAWVQMFVVKLMRPELRDRHVQMSNPGISSLYNICPILFK